jgi:alkaline phosphatase D
MVSVALLCCAAALAQDTRQATGVKVGEVTENSAIVWVRHTARATRNPNGDVWRRKGLGRILPAGTRVDELEGACPGAPGRVRVRYGTRPDLRDAKATAWVAVSAKTDFAHQFRLSGLSPATVYYYASETEGHAPLRGRFETAPPPDRRADVTFTVITGQMYADVDDQQQGYKIYDAMLKVAPKFIVPTGDNVYYDNEDPRANSVEVARYHWQRMFSYPRHIAFFLNVPAFFEKDDHDTLFNDCWPAMNPKQMLPLTFAEGQQIYLEQVPMGDKTWRTFRWGRGVQIWLPEGRDFRSPNNAPDGPEKTIWGQAQKEWIKKTILSSNADYRILVCETPIVGPDRGAKGDNHANKAFATEGNEFRQWVKENGLKNFYVACGDRHWQYHSVHPATGVQEFSCGPASDEHAGGSPGYDAKYHRFHRMQGGFLSVSVRDGKISFRHHDVNGKVVYQYTPDK